MNKKNLIALLLIWCIPLTLLCTQKEGYQAKTAWIKIISQFVKWPGVSAMNDTSKPFVIVVIGKTPFSSYLESAYSDTGEKRKIEDKKVILKYIASPDEITDCHLLFISGTSKKSLTKILAITKDKPILTIGDTKGYGERGTHINFFKSGKKLAFEINPGALKQASLSAEKALITYAKKIVKTRKEKK
ncbi:MAG: YfiR family protein [bacterium]|nr:YfiR family protein [bacterium]